MVHNLRILLDWWGAISALAMLFVAGIIVAGTIYDRRQWGRSFWKDQD